MKWREYIASKAAGLCFLGIAALLWGIFAYFAGANAAVLWGSEIFFACAAAIWLALGFFFVSKRLKKLEKTLEGLKEPYLLGELLEKPRDAAEKEYFRVMKEVSRSAIGTAEIALKEKEEYCEYVESWIHEIKTPLTACSLILDNGGDTGKLKRELKRADNLTETILYYARLRSSEKDIKIGKINAADIVAEAVKSQRELLVAARIGVEAKGDFSVYTDGKSLCFILKQLLINCAKYCRGCRVEITVEDGCISVSDNGPGIPSHELRRVTSRGFTGANGKSAGGTGMGLYIVSELCKKLEIELEIFSEVGKGTKFVLRFESLKKSYENVREEKDGVR